MAEKRKTARWWQAAFRTRSEYGTRKFHSNVTGCTLMRPIELTRTHDNGKTEPFYINPDQIVSFGPAWKDVGSYLTLAVGGSYTISETPEQIIDRLADHRSTMRAEAYDGIQVY